jgi:hypothetical protein
MQDRCIAIHGYAVGWVKRDEAMMYVGFAYLDAAQLFEIELKLANPTRLVAICQLNPTYNTDKLYRCRVSGVRRASC